MQGNLQHLPQPKGQTCQWETQRGTNPPLETNSLHKTSKAGAKIDCTRNISFYPHEAKLCGPLLSLNLPTSCTHPMYGEGPELAQLHQLSFITCCNPHCNMQQDMPCICISFFFSFFHVCTTLKCKGGECK